MSRYLPRIDRRYHRAALIAGAIAWSTLACQRVGFVDGAAPARDAAVAVDAVAPTDVAASPGDLSADVGLVTATSWRVCATVGRPDSVFSLAASPDGQFLAAGAYQTSLWDLRTGRLLRMVGTDGGIKPGFSRDSSLLTLGGDARYVVRVSDGATVTEIGNGAAGCVAWSSEAALSPDGMVVALGACSAVERFGRDGTLLGTLPSHVFSPGVAYSPDGRWLATSGPELWRADGSERLWPAIVQAGPPPLDLASATDYLADNVVAFSPDGALLLVSNAPPAQRGITTGAWTTSAQLLRVSDGTLVRDFGTTLSRHPSFSPDGAWLLAGGQLLHLASGAQVSFADAIVVSTFLPDGRIAAADDQRVVRLYCPSP